MQRTSLDDFVDGVSSDWTQSRAVDALKTRLEHFIGRAAAEPWLERLRRERPPTTELHRDGRLGYLLLAHAEPPGLYRAPHDHGRSWVIYGVVEGQLEVGTYARNERGAIDRLGVNIIRPGEVRAYLRGDIHDTRSLGGPALILRFTERDLRQDEAAGHPITRYDPPSRRGIAGAPS